MENDLNDSCPANPMLPEVPSRRGQFSFRGRPVPPDLMDGLFAYVETGRPVGHFLRACIDNDLGQAIARADDSSLQALPAIAGWLYNEAPSGCHGRPGSHDAWVKQKSEERAAAEGLQP